LLQKTAILGTSHIIRKVLQSETWSLRGGDYCWFMSSTRTKRPVTRDIIIIFFIPMARQPLGGLGRLIFRDFTITHTTLGRTPLDDGPARRRDLYLTTHNTHKRQTSMP
jgi:hypothetical protein